MKIQFKWKHPKRGLYHCLQTWGTGPKQRRIVAILDHGASGTWYTSMHGHGPIYPVLFRSFMSSVRAKKHVMDNVYPKIPTLR